MDVVDVYYVGGFGVMGWVRASEYEQAQPDPLADATGDFVQHMNADHKDALILRQRILHQYLRKLVLAPDESCSYWKTARSDARMTARGHLDRTGGNIVRPMQRLAVPPDAAPFPSGMPRTYQHQERGR